MQSTETEYVETDLQPILLTSHAAERRKLREITLAELRTAIRYGVKEPAENGRWKYTWNGVVVIASPDSSEIVTSWTLPGFGVDLAKVNITPQMLKRHHEAVRRLNRDMSTWTSHTVAVVDTSGSMRTTDADQGLSRAELVWLTLAVQLVATNLKSGERTDTDVFSLVGMESGGNVIIRKKPFDWVLYNELVDMLRGHQPFGPGEYFPALKKAQSLLMENQYGGCALAMVFLSDGRPSDELISVRKGGLPQETRIKLKISDIASQIGSRLSIMAIPLGSGDLMSDFGTLKALVEEAELYGSRGMFQRPSLSTRVLETSMKMLTSTTTATMVNMGKRVYREFRKEPRHYVGGSILTDEFDFIRQEIFVQDGWAKRRIIKTSWGSGEGWKTAQVGMTFHSPLAVGLAIKKAWFEEGAERLVKEIREVNSSRVFVGPLMVAKDTKYVHGLDGRDKVEVEKDFHRVFIKSQKKAQKYAQYFNHALDQHPAIDSTTCPRIEFLECAVYMIEPEDAQRQGYLVEKMLDLKRFNYQKWNDNRGNSSGTAAFFSDNNLLDGMIEDYEEEGSSGTSSGSSMDLEDQGEIFTDDDTSFDVNDVPQAFSCFSSWLSKRRFLICDLQGIFNTDLCPPVFELTDPVIHHRESVDGHRVYGRTDNGMEGIRNFHATHKCSNLCRMARARAFVDVKDI